MLAEFGGFERIIVVCGRTDLRKGLDGLASIVQNQFSLDPFQKNVLFLFCGSRSNKIKGLVWEGDGFLLLYKRIEDGHFQWPRNREDAMAITPEQLAWLLRGLTMEPSIRKVSPQSVL